MHDKDDLSEKRHKCADGDTVCGAKYFLPAFRNNTEIGRRMTMTYKEFLQTKVEIAKDSGFEISPDEVNAVLKPHQRDAVVWAVRGGKRALFDLIG